MASDPDETAQKTSPSPLRRWLPLLVLVAALAGAFGLGAHRLLSMEALVLNKAALEKLVADHRVLAIVAFAVIYVVVTALSIPGALFLTLIGGFLFPLWIAFPVILIAATTGATLLFLVAGSSLGAALRERANGTAAKLAAGLRADAASYLLFLRLVPVFPFALVNLAPALVGVPLRTFVWTTFVGILPGTLAFTVAAGSLGGILDQQKRAHDACLAAGSPSCPIVFDPGALIGREMLLVFAALGCVALIPVVARRFLKKKGSDAHAA